MKCRQTPIVSYFKLKIYCEHFFNSNIDDILDELDMPEGSITVDTYDEFIEDNDVAYMNLTNCVVEDFLDTVILFSFKGPHHSRPMSLIVQLVRGSDK